MTAPLLSVDGLAVSYLGDDGDVTVVDGVSFDVHAGEVFGLAGESGSGKSTVAHAVLRLLAPPAAITAGDVSWKGRSLLAASRRELRQVRWSEISLVMQSAMNALNPVATVGDQLTDAARARRRSCRSAGELLELVGIDPARDRSYPHQLSGGMRQRVAIAMALALEPDLVIMDEPTTALDVIVQREILDQVARLNRELGVAVVLITHDLSVMFELCSRIAVLYAGRLAEVGPARELLADPHHPYTRGLLRSIPDLTGDRPDAGIPGAPPDPRQPPSGCRFHPRCPMARDVCRAEAPAVAHLRARSWACHEVEAPR